MEAIPVKCKDINKVSSFCDCITEAGSVDPAAQNFCARAKTGSDPYVTGEDLAELKKALTDLES